MANSTSDNDQARDEEQKAAWLEEIRQNPTITAYLDQFQAKSVEHFLTDYLRTKSDWHAFGPAYLEESEQKSIRWIAAASAHLPIILQKKLFDVQCRWRAEQLDIPELQLCCEFQVWERNILNCSFIEPLTESDIELYQAYLLTSPEDIDIETFYDWQDLEEVRKRFRDEDDDLNYPEWYEFVNIRTGAGSLLLLPDIRGQKEKFYTDLARVERQQNFLKKQAEPGQEQDDRPWISLDDERLEAFVMKFENSESIRLYNSYNYFKNRMNFRDDMEWELELLSEAEETVPIESHTNWRIALKNAASKYERKKLVEALPQAWEQYRMNIDLGIGFPVPRRSDYGWLVDMHKEMILRGRVLNGDPEDLLF